MESRRAVYLSRIPRFFLVERSFYRVETSAGRVGKWLNSSMTTETDLMFKYYRCDFTSRVTIPPKLWLLIRMLELLLTLELTETDFDCGIIDKTHFGDSLRPLFTSPLHRFLHWTTQYLLLPVTFKKIRNELCEDISRRNVANAKR